MKNRNEEILFKIKNLLKKLAPNARILLYGSHARGDFRNGSDWDILVILDKQKIEPSDYEYISYPIYEMGWQENEFFSIKLYTKSEWFQRSFTPFYKNVEKESIIL
jgi:uncharacterized protein